MLLRILVFLSALGLSMGQPCPGCFPGYNSGGCAGCGPRTYRFPMMQQMLPSPYGPCGGLPCQRPPMPGHNGHFGGMGQEQQVFGIPDPIVTDTGRLINAPFQPPKSIPPLRVGTNPLFNPLS
ncbi:unnamed protein product [Cylicocyclus nassatus]|uniref:Uncharacterized protein n=1 Tax=Cylicocyclus nassatus TaxID=53992 RepID=A0AA36MB00_CYLNA|nr:unnamed protein product [Cylicocyclus nassatus]